MVWLIRTTSSKRRGEDAYFIKSVSRFAESTTVLIRIMAPYYSLWHCCGLHLYRMQGSNLGTWFDVVEVHARHCWVYCRSRRRSPVYTRSEFNAFKMHLSKHVYRLFWISTFRILWHTHRQLQYRHLITAPVDRTSASAWLYKHPGIAFQKSTSMTLLTCESKLPSVLRSLLRLLLSRAQGHNDFLKLFKPCHVGIHVKALSDYSQMRVFTCQGFSHFWGF